MNIIRYILTMYNGIIITRKERDCIVAIGKHSDGPFPVRLVDLSHELGIKTPTTLNLVKRLNEKGLVIDDKGMIVLTENGLGKFNEIQEIHRIIETLMVKYGVDLNRACAISQHIDFLMDHRSVDNIFEKLGKPSICPHGENIEQFH
jgi:DtxR family Mn-dependent transcriptional regulator